MPPDTAGKGSPPDRAEHLHRRGCACTWGNAGKSSGLFSKRLVVRSPHVTPGRPALSYARFGSPHGCFEDRRFPKRPDLLKSRFRSQRLFNPRIGQFLMGHVDLDLGEIRIQ